MLLTISTTHAPATDLGWLLHKNPTRIQRFPLSFGAATVAYPEANAERCTVALLLEVDPVGLVRGRQGPSGDNGALEQYVNDRPYVASSFLSVAIGEVFGSALNGRSKDRPDLVDCAMPLTLSLSAVPARGGEALLRRLFEPLGYAVDLQPVALDAQYPQWGDSRYYGVTLTATLRVRDALAHLYVLIPVLDNEKHYWIGEAEVDKLLRHGGDWLPAHPERELIARRYLKFRRSLADAALAQLAETEQDDGEQPDPAADVAAAPASLPREQRLEEKISLNQQRIAAVVALIDASDATSIVDLGCGEGRLLRELIKLRHLQRIVGLDVSMRSLEIAHERLKLDRMPERQLQRLQLLHGALTYRDSRLSGFDAATVIEVIEHLDPARLAAFERVLFEAAAPRLIVVTTPNVEYNVRFETLPAGQFRHPDHRFEWTRVQFEDWSRALAERHGYAVAFAGIGDADPELGAPTQLARFERIASEASA